MLKDIEALLNDGMTPEEIYQNALRITEAKTAAKKKIEKDIADARKSVIDSMSIYVEKMLGEKPDATLMKELNESLESFEEMIKKFNKPSKTDDDDALIKFFLKNIGAMG